MGRRRGTESKSYTLPSSPSHSFSSSSSSDFEFTISISPRKSSTALCPADELFYKGQLLPLHLSPRISMVRTLLLSSSSTSSSTNSTAPRDSSGSSSSFASDLALFPDCDSSRPSSATEDDDFKRLHNHNYSSSSSSSSTINIKNNKAPNKYFSFSRFSSVFRKDTTTATTKLRDPPDNAVKRMSATAKEVIRKYLKKVKPLYDRLSQKHQQHTALDASASASASTSVISLLNKSERSTKDFADPKRAKKETVSVLSHSFSGNLRYPRRRSCVSSCPSSMRSSPSHSGVLSQKGLLHSGLSYGGDASSMEELQSAIQGAIAHCKNSLIQNKTMVSNEI